MRLQGAHLGGILFLALFLILGQLALLALHHRLLSCPLFNLKGTGSPTPHPMALGSRGGSPGDFGAPLQLRVRAAAGTLPSRCRASARALLCSSASITSKNSFWALSSASWGLSSGISSASAS